MATKLWAMDAWHVLCTAVTVQLLCCRRPSSLKKAFSLCDQNKSGQLDTEDLGRVVEEILPFVPSEEQLSFFRYALCTFFVLVRALVYVMRALVYVMQGSMIHAG